MDQAKTENTAPTTQPTNTAPTNTLAAYALTIGGIALLLLLLGLLFMVFFRRKKSTNPSTAKARPSAQDPSPVAVMQKGPNPPAGNATKQKQASSLDDGMIAFGAPPKASQPAQPSSASIQTVVSGTLRPWPCGHMNRSNARYCSICGEPAPPPPTSRRMEQ